MISLTLILPVTTAILICLIPRGNERSVRYTAFFGSVATLGFALTLLMRFDPAEGGYQTQLAESYPWIPSLGISYKVGIDGISIFMVILTALLTPIALLCSWRSIVKRVPEFHISLLVLEAGMLGVFVATDLILFYVFWEVMLIPMYLLIGVWGSGNRIYAAVKFIIYTAVGSFVMFLAILYLYFHLSSVGVNSFDLERIYEAFSNPQKRMKESAQMLCFLAFALSFAIKVPLFPFHTWLPDAHTEAPTAASVILAGVLLKMGTYGFIRFAIPFFPEAAAELAPAICVLSIVGIIFGALMCLMQNDMKRLIAYSSVSHLGFVMLGIFVFTERGLVGGIYQMINHGISTGALFLLVGVIYERRHTRRIKDYGGIASVAPRLAVVFFVTTLSSIGLPFLNGFIGEFLILQGSFEINFFYALFAGTGVVLGALYMLSLYRRIFLGEVNHKENRSLEDLNLREMGYFVPLLALMVILGLFSPWFTDRMVPSVQQWFQQINLEITK